MRKIKVTIVLTLIISFMFSKWMEFEFVEAIYFTAPFLLLTICIYLFLANQRILNRYSKQYDNSYIVGTFPHRASFISIPHLSTYIRLCGYHDVRNTVEREKELLLKAKNPFYCNPDLTEKGKLQVIGYIFQDGENKTENEEQYIQRVTISIEEDIIKRHAVLKKVDHKWYHIHCNHQRNIA